MPGGIDIGTETIIVATPSGTTRHRNAMRPVDDGERVDDATLTVRVGDSRYVIGDAAGTVGGGDDTVERLFGGPRGERDRDVAGSALDALLAGSAGANGDDSPDGGSVYGYVSRDPETLSELSQLAADRAVEVTPVDPGMAVCYDAFETPPDGLGVALGDGRAFAALAVGGVPVATATVAYRGRWYDVTDAVADLDGAGVRPAWNREQYVALFGELARELAAEAPALAGPVAVALGGVDTPVGLAAADLRRAGETLGAEIESVTAADTPDEAPARGALVATQPGARSGPVPAFAATDAYAHGLVDIGAATDAFAGAVEGATEPRSEPAREARTRPAPAAGVDSGIRDTTDTGAGGTHLPTDGVGWALHALVEHLDGETDRLRRLVEDLEETVEAELAELEQQMAASQAVGELETAIERTEEGLEELDDDISEIRAVLAGLDEGTFEGSDGALAPGEAFESVAVDALQDDIESVETALSGRIETLWEEIDDIDARLVDLSARLGDLPELEDDLQSTSAAVEELSAGTRELRQSLTALQERIEAAEGQMATADDVESVAADLDRIEGDLDEVRTQLQEADWVEPAQLDAHGRDLDALRETVVDHAQRLEGVERTTSDLDDRLEQAFRNTAKAEALSSLQTEVSRIQTRLSSTDAAESGDVESLDARLDTLQEEVDQLRKMVDSLAESTVTRSELDETTERLEGRLTETTDSLDSRLADLEAQGRPTARPEGTPTGDTDSRFMLQLLAIALATVCGLGALFAAELARMDIAVGFLALAAGPVAVLWLSRGT